MKAFSGHNPSLFANGGVVYYTGPAVVHGSNTNPELVFHARDASKLYRLVHESDDLANTMFGNMKDLFYKGLNGMLSQMPWKETSSTTAQDNRVYIGNVELNEHDSADLLAVLRNVSLAYKPW